jgi:hypothetical protein
MSGRYSSSNGQLTKTLLAYGGVRGMSSPLYGSNRGSYVLGRQNIMCWRIRRVQNDSVLPRPWRLLFRAFLLLGRHGSTLSLNRPFIASPGRVVVPFSRGRHGSRSFEGLTRVNS